MDSTTHDCHFCLKFSINCFCINWIHENSQIWIGERVFKKPRHWAHWELCCCCCTCGLFPLFLISPLATTTMTTIWKNHHQKQTATGASLYQAHNEAAAVGRDRKLLRTVTTAAAAVVAVVIPLLLQWKKGKAKRKKERKNIHSVCHS